MSLNEVFFQAYRIIQTEKPFSAQTTTAKIIPLTIMDPFL